MLYQELPPIESTRLDRWERWLAPALAIAAGMTVGALLLLIGQPWLALAATAGGFAGAAFVGLRSAPRSAPIEPIVVGPDYSLVGSALSPSFFCQAFLRS